MPQRISVDEAVGRRVSDGIGAVRNDLDRAGSQLSALRAPIQPAGQVWPVAAELARAWTQRMDELQQWYHDRAAELGAVEANVAAVQGIHGDTEEAAVDLAGRWAR
jgi:hypothetical protein